MRGTNAKRLVDRHDSGTAVSSLDARGNAADVFPEPVTPAFVTMYLGPGLSQGLRDAYTEFGSLDWDEYENPNQVELFKVFGGYLYNPLSLTRLMGARMPGLTPELIDKAFFDDRDEVPAVRRRTVARIRTPR